MINFKHLTMAAVAVSAFSTYCAVAEEQGSKVSGNIGITSNYLFRGVSASGDDPAVFGGVDYEHGDGVYFGVWASTLTDSNYELDLYGGFGSQLGGVEYDVGYVRYAYPEQDSADYAEIYLSLSYSLVEVGVYFTVDSEINNGTGSAFVKGDIYYYVSVDHDFGEGWSIGGTAGTYMFEDDDLVAAGFDYSHLQIDLSKSFGVMGDLTLTLSVTDEINGVSDDDDVLPSLTWVKNF